MTTERGADPLVAARSVARLLDSVVRIPVVGVRFGIDPLLGLVPGVGDIAGALLSGYIVLVGARLGAPPAVVWRMLLNVAIDTVVGSVPLIGDAFDVGWQSNNRNIALLEGFLEQPRATARGSRLVMLGTIAALAVLAAAGVAATLLLVRAIVAAVR